MGLPVVGGGERPLEDFRAVCVNCGTSIVPGQLWPSGGCPSPKGGATPCMVVWRTADGAVLDAPKMARDSAPG